MDESNVPKDLLRSRYDLSFIRRSLPVSESERTYFGLPAAGMLDVVCWRELLDRAVCVDRSGDTINAMKVSANAAGLFDVCTFLRGDVGAVLKTKVDEDGSPLPDSLFDVVNLDLEGALFQSDPAERLDAIDALFRHQREFEGPFVLFLTLGFRSVRKHPMTEVDRKLRDIERELEHDGVEAGPTVQWYFSRHSTQRLKVYVPYAVEERARPQRYSLSRYLAFHYLGTGGVHMMHFAMHLTYSEDQVAPPRTSLRRLLTAPLYQVTDGPDAHPEPAVPPELRPRGAT